MPSGDKLNADCVLLSLRSPLDVHMEQWGEWGVQWAARERAVFRGAQFKLQLLPSPGAEVVEYEFLSKA